MSGAPKLVQNVVSLWGTASFEPFTGSAPLTKVPQKAPPWLDSLANPPPLSNIFYQALRQEPLSATALKMDAIDAPTFKIPAQWSFMEDCKGETEFRMYLVWQFPDGSLRTLYCQPWGVYWHCYDEWSWDGPSTSSHTLVVSPDSEVSVDDLTKTTEHPPALEAPSANSVISTWQ